MLFFLYFLFGFLLDFSFIFGLHFAHILLNKSNFVRFRASDVQKRSRGAFFHDFEWFGDDFGRGFTIFYLNFK